MPFWSATSTTLANDQMYVNNTYKDANGKNKLTTISSANTTGYVPIDPNSTDPIVKKTSYAVQNDGKITYQYEDGTGNKTQYNSIQQIANDGLKGYSDATTAKIKNSMQSNLSTSATTQKVGPSTATTDPNSSTPQITGTQQDLLNNESVKDKDGKDGGVRKTYENLRYPIDRDTKQDYILFTMKRYSPRSYDVAAASSASGDIFGDRIPVSKGKEITGSVSLPIQPNIADSNAVKWGEDPMDSLDALTQGVFTGAVSGNGEQAATNAGGIVTPALPALKSAGVAELAKRATGSNKSLFTRTTGAVFNPNVELLFTGPSLRGFQFNFSLSAREPKEAKEIKKIIRFFKQGMSVKKAASTLFLKSPNTFDIQYFYNGNNHPWINRIKECALTNFTVNYTPAGNYATFEDGAMTQYDITLSFTELDPIYDDDYTKLDGDADNDIGY
jgi:hypothetical protein